MGIKVGTQKIVKEPGYLYYLGKDGYVWASPMRGKKNLVKKRVGTEKISREPKHLYYLSKDGYISKAPMGAKK